MYAANICALLAWLSIDMLIADWSTRPHWQPSSANLVLCGRECNSTSDRETETGGFLWQIYDDERARNWRILGSIGLKMPRQLQIGVNNDSLAYFIRPGVMILASGA